MIRQPYFPFVKLLEIDGPLYEQNKCEHPVNSGVRVALSLISVLCFAYCYLSVGLFPLSKGNNVLFYNMNNITPQNIFHLHK